MPIPSATSSSLSSLSSTHSNASTSQLILTAFVILLHRYTPDPSLAICTASKSESPLLLLLDLSNEGATFADVLSEVIKKEHEAQQDVVEMERLVDHIKAEGPLFRVKFIDESSDSDSTSTYTSSSSASLSTDMTLSLSNNTLKISYNAMLFSQRRIELVLESLCQLIHSTATSPTSAMSVLPIRAEDSISQDVLPDPTSDLDWCGFKGAITDIFSKNALAHPDKPCVIQSSSGTDLAASIATITSFTSASGASQRRTVYTYKQIDEASNILGHALKKAGLERGEVVMVYAARSVELVVCVMGVLKAGGVFSVIGELVDLRINQE